MTIRRLIWIALRAAAGICAAFVTIRGALGVYGIDFRVDTLISVFYCSLPFLSFFVFLFAKRPRIELVLHAVIAVGYCSSFTFLNWRTCSSIGYCTTVTATLWTTLMARSVLAAFAVVFLSAGALGIDSEIR
jgi:hypothetical protein